VGDVVRDAEKFRRGWTGGLPETKCGHGSMLAQTVRQREWMPEMIRKYEIESIADIGAGDLNWIKKMDLAGASYRAYDLVPRLPQVVAFDLVNDVAPRADLLMCLWVLNHLEMEPCRQAIANLKASGSKYLMMTDRPIWHHEQPKEIIMQPIESLRLNNKNDSILLVRL